MQLKALLYLAIVLAVAMHAASAQNSAIVLQPAAVFDGQEIHAGWSVVVSGDKIAAAGPSDTIPAPADARTIDLPNETLLPGMIEDLFALFGLSVYWASSGWAGAGNAAALTMALLFVAWGFTKLDIKAWL